MIYDVNGLEIEVRVPTRADIARWMGMAAKWGSIDDLGDQMAERYVCDERWLLTLGVTQEQIDALSVGDVIRLCDRVYTDAMPTGAALGKSEITRRS